jgi:hypothetical protein
LQAATAWIEHKVAICRLRNEPVAEARGVAGLELITSEVGELVDLLGVGDLAVLVLAVVLGDLLDVGGVDATAEDELLLGLVSLGVLGLVLGEAGGGTSGGDTGKGGEGEGLHCRCCKFDSLLVCRREKEAEQVEGKNG